MASPLTKLALLDARTSDTQLLHAELLELCTRTRLEPGCLQFTFFYLDESRTRLALFERFRDQAAMDEHMRNAHTQRFFRQQLISVSKLHNLEELVDAPTPEHS